MSFAARVTNLKPEGAYQVLARSQALQANGRDLVHLEIGEPDFETLPSVSLAGIGAIAEGHTRYTPPIELGALQEVIAELSFANSISVIEKALARMHDVLHRLD